MLSVRSFQFIIVNKIILTQEALDPVTVRAAAHRADASGTSCFIVAL